MTQKSRLALSVGAATLTAAILAAVSISQKRLTSPEQAGAAATEAAASVTAPEPKPSPVAPTAPLSASTKSGFSARQKNARKLRDFIDGRITGDVPPFENAQTKYMAYFEAHPPPWKSGMDPQILVDLCWDGLAMACFEAGNQAYVRAYDLEEKLKDPSLSVDRKTAMMSELAQLKTIGRDTEILSCLQGLSISCTKMDPAVNDAFNDILKRQLDYFCSHGNPTYCNARADLRPPSTETPSTEKTDHQKELYAKACSGGDLIACGNVIDYKGSAEATQAARRALEDDCRAGDNEEVKSFPWTHASSCQAVTNLHLQSGDAREAFAAGRRRCDDGDTLQCYELASQMMKAGDGHAAFEMMRQFCKKNDNKKFRQPSEADCKLIADSPTLTTETWAALLRAPSNPFFATPDALTFRELYEQRPKK